MARDIEEFLRRAAERRQQQKNQAGPPSEPRSPAKPSPREQRRTSEPIDAEIVESPTLSRKAQQSDQEVPIARQKLQSEMRQESVSEYVDRHLNTSRITEHSQTLGKRIASIHDEIDVEVHRHLDHDISVVDDKPSITNAPRPGIVGSIPSAASRELLAMLTQPKTIRQAILMSEILQRPSFEDD